MRDQQTQTGEEAQAESKYCSDCEMWLNGPTQWESHKICKVHKKKQGKREAKKNRLALSHMALESKSRGGRSSSPRVDSEEERRTKGLVVEGGTGSFRSPFAHAGLSCRGCYTLAQRSGLLLYILLITALPCPILSGGAELGTVVRNKRDNNSNVSCVSFAAQVPFQCIMAGKIPANQFA